MKQYLLPHRLKKFGWIILFPSIILGVIQIVYNFEAFPFEWNVFSIYYSNIFEPNQQFSFIKTNVTNTIIGVMFLVGALLVSFSKEKEEDEFISKIRLTSLLWAVLVNYTLLIFFFLFVYGTAFLQVMLFNMFTILILFIIKFHYTLYKNSINEKHN